MQRKVIVIPEGPCHPYVDFIDVNDFDKVRETIEGYIEIVRPGGLNDNNCILVDEEGLVKHRDRNFISSKLYGGTIVGTSIMCKEVLGDEGGELAGLTDSDVQWFVRYLNDLNCEYACNFILDRTKEVD